MMLGPLGDQVQGHLLEVVGDHGAVARVDDGRHGDAAVVVGEASEVGLLEALDAEHRIPAALIEVEGPGALVVGRTGHGQDRKSTRLNSSHVALSYAGLY